MSDSYGPKFVTNLKKFLEDLQRYHPTSGVEKLLTVYKSLKMERIIQRVHEKLNPLIEQIKENDEMIFVDNLTLLPGLNLQTIWPELSNKQKKKVWAYLNLLHVLSDLIIDSARKMKTTSSAVPTATEDEQQAVTQLIADTQVNTESATEDSATPAFNPYAGIGAESEAIDVDALFSGPEKLPGDENEDGGGGGLGLDALIGGAGLNEMIDMKELQDELLGMTEDDLKEITSGLGGILGGGEGDAGDDQTNNLFSSMISNITQTLKTADLNSGNSFQDIFGIAQSVADNMQDQITEEDMNVLIKTAQSTTAKYASEMGIDPTDDPSKMAAELMGKINNSDQKRSF